MSNNPILYNAIIAGVTGGNQHRWLSDSEPVNYAIFQAVAVTIAEAVDAGISTGTFDQSQGLLMYAICYGIFSNRDAVNIRHELPAISTAIAELFNNTVSLLEAIS